MRVVRSNHWTRRGFLATCAAPALQGSPVEEGFKPLCNGRDLSGWEGDTSLWLVEDSMLVGRSSGITYNDFLATKHSYSDFILRLEVHLVSNSGNSGIQFRSERVRDSTEMIGYQADIGPTWWGSLYDESRRRKTLAGPSEELAKTVVKPDGWNTYEIEARGKQIRLKLNGTTTVDYEETDPAIPATGRIALQIHSGPALEVRFRNLRLRVL
jgi:hypothetical protein